MPPPIPTPIKTVTPTVPIKHSVTHTVSSSVTHTVTHVVHHTTPSLFYNPLKGVYLSPILIFVLGIGILIAMALTLKWIKGRKLHMGDIIYALAVDKQKREVEVVPCEKIHDRLYISRGSEPAFLVLSPKVLVFKLRERGRELNIVFAKRKGVLLIPIDPSLMESLGIPEVLDEGALELRYSSIVEALKDLYSYVGKREGSIKITPQTKIYIAYNPSDLVNQMIDQTMEGGASVVQQFFSTVKSADVLEKAAQSMLKYVQARANILIYIAVIAIAVGIAIVLAGQVLHP